MLADQVLVARQPISDRKGLLVAYELLFRSARGQGPTTEAPEVLTAIVAVQAILDIGLDELVGSVPAWINLPRTTLVSGQFNFLPRERVVLEVLEQVEADTEVVRALRTARKEGYRIALDDFVLNERTRPLLEVADYVKLDVLDRNPAEIRAAFEAVARPGLQVLAEKVETRAVRDVAMEVGYHLFQGYHFARPDIVPGRRMPTDRNALLRLLAELHDPATPLDRIEELVAADVGLGVRLLRYVNAVSVGVRGRFDSLRHAIVMLGLDRLRECVSMLVLAGLEEKPSQLVTMALVRARLCEQLGLRFAGDAHRHFSGGLLSLIDAFLDQPLDEILTRMPLADELSRALLYREGPIGRSIEAAEACERADWGFLNGAPWDANTLRTCYVDALRWTGRVQSSLAEA
ncbi:MAG: HDOD domain-containing protein [Planctomycetes bacterium]|nr:HDOD domain-containing protein [Planctomycetota bacterium]